MIVLWSLSGKDAKVRGLAAPSNLSMNQNLDGHSGKLIIIIVIITVVDCVIRGLPVLKCTGITISPWNLTFMIVFHQIYETGKIEF